MSCNRRARRLAALLCCLGGLRLEAQTVSQVRARPLAGGAVEVLYDLAGAAPYGETVTLSYSFGACSAPVLVKATATTGQVGPGVQDGRDLRIVWNTVASLPAGEPHSHVYLTVSASRSTIGPEGEEAFTLPGGLAVALARIPAGTFRMGAPRNERGYWDEPAHDVTLTKDYMMGRTEVTQAQWTAVMGNNPSRHPECGGDCPVDLVSWDDITMEGGFLDKLNVGLRLSEAARFRLPTEAEWERAARGGTQTRFWFGDALECDDDLCVPCPSADPYLWWCGNADGVTHPVGQKFPNPYGLYDVHGNVVEWCQDRFAPYPTHPVTDPIGVTPFTARVIRGGSHRFGLYSARAALRWYYQPRYHPDYAFGLRLARNADPLPVASLCAGPFAIAVPDVTPLRSRVVPIVLDAFGAGGAHFSTELTFTNRGSEAVSLEWDYHGSLGSRTSGSAGDVLRAGEQRTVADALAYLRSLGIAVPPGTPQSGQGGLLLFRYRTLQDVVAVTARTTTPTAPPHPVGRAGLAYGAARSAAAFESLAVLYGLRSDDRDRSNLALYNPSAASVTLRVRVFAGDGSGRAALKADGIALEALGWMQMSDVLEGTGIQQGWAIVEKTGGNGAFGAYAVVNDRLTGDGSFLPAVGGELSGARITVPVLVETPGGYRSELVLANRGAVPATLTLAYVERLAPELGTGGSATLRLGPGEQLLLRDAHAFLRQQGLAIGMADAASYGGSLRVTVNGAPLSDVYAGARTSIDSAGGGRFGVFTPGVYPDGEAGAEAVLNALRDDGDERSNVALMHAGDDRSGDLTIELQAYDGEAGGAPVGAPVRISLRPGEWRQLGGLLKDGGARTGWVRLRRLAGSAPWIAYAILNDGRIPGERTGDGAYLAMEMEQPPGS